jgi:hypothetical protein
LVYFYGHLVYFMAIWYILWSFGIFYGHLICISRFGFVVSRKIWQPCRIVATHLFLDSPIVFVYIKQ